MKKNFHSLHDLHCLRSNKNSCFASDKCGNKSIWYLKDAESSITTLTNCIRKPVWYVWVETNFYPNWQADPLWNHGSLRETFSLPSEESELTANMLWAHMKTHGKLILKPLICLTANSQDELTLWACCEPSVSLQLTPWACCELFVRSTNELIMQW